MLNKLILRAFFSISLALSFTGAANATLISQDILDAGDVIGNITINIDNATEWDIGDSYVENFVSFNIAGLNLLDLANYNLDNPLFEAHFNQDDLTAGLSTLYFDLIDVQGAFAWAGNIWAGTDANDLNVFDDGTGIVAYSDNISFGKATVVPTPVTLVLFLTAVAGLAARRKNS